MNVFFSQQGEDLLIYRNFINKKCPDGIYLELGACNGVLYSNTLFLEKYLLFTGILIEPVKQMFNKLIVNRNKNICYNVAISSNVDNVDFLINGPVSGIKNHMSSSQIEKREKGVIEKIKTKKLSDIFKEQNISYIDFFSLDVEGGELDILKTIDWNKISMYLICIELDDNNLDRNNECRKILSENGFIFQVKMCINEFWVNPNYFRKDLLFDTSIKKNKFIKNMNHYGIHMFLEPHCKSTIENTIYNFENK